MTHPLTPREKVAQIIDANKYEAWTVDRAGQMADAILTALATGSGDHAELAALREHRITADLLVSSLKADKAEAERKLAEADRAARQIVELKIPPGNDPEQRLKLLSLLAKAQVLARTFLSKEAERG